MRDIGVKTYSKTDLNADSLLVNKISSGDGGISSLGNLKILLVGLRKAVWDSKEAIKEIYLILNSNNAGDVIENVTSALQEMLYIGKANGQI